jgi:hypothetical protein
MRMWMTNPKLMCRKHLLGEHLELHMFVGALKKKKNLYGYLNNNLFEPLSILSRHNSLVKEMRRRGYNHKTPMNFKVFFYLFHLKWKILVRINRCKSTSDLILRCKYCYKNKEY